MDLDECGMKLQATEFGFSGNERDFQVGVDGDV